MNKEKIYLPRDLNSMVHVTDGIKHNRYYIPDPTLPFTYEDLIEHKDWFITLVHHNVLEHMKNDTLIKYTIKFFKDDITETPSPINVALQTKHPTNNSIVNSQTAILAGKIPAILNESYYDKSLISIPIAHILNLDTMAAKPYSGVVCSLQIDIPKLNYDNHIYYEFESATDYEIMNRVGLFEWVISDGIYGDGNVYYRKIIYGIPSDIQNKIIIPDVDKDDDEYVGED